MASPLKPEAFDRIERADLSRSLPAESTVRSAGSDSSSARRFSSSLSFSKLSVISSWICSTAMSGLAPATIGICFFL